MEDSGLVVYVPRRREVSGCCKRTLVRWWWNPIVLVSGCKRLGDERDVCLRCEGQCLAGELG